MQYFILGTGLVKPEEPEPKIGRILVLQLTALSSNMYDLRVLMEQAVNGAVYSVVPMTDCPGKLVATVNSQVCVFEIDPADTGNVLKLRCKTKTQVCDSGVVLMQNTVVLLSGACSLKLLNVKVQ